MKILFFLLLLPFTGGAQQAGDSCWKIRTGVAAGIIAGSNHAAGAAQISTGLAHRIFYAGLGVGYDAYRYKTMPVFAETRVYPTRQRNWFGYGDIGYGLMLEKGKPDQFTSLVKDDLRGGAHLELGLACAANLGPGNRLLVSLGWSRKTITEGQKYMYVCPGGPCDLISGTTSKYIRSFSRIVLKVGFELGK